MTNDHLNCLYVFPLSGLDEEFYVKQDAVKGVMILILTTVTVGFVSPSHRWC